jgi:hypothetical protein
MANVSDAVSQRAILIYHWRSDYKSDDAPFPRFTTLQMNSGSTPADCQHRMRSQQPGPQSSEHVG